MKVEIDDGELQRLRAIEDKARELANCLYGYYNPIPEDVELFGLHGGWDMKDYLRALYVLRVALGEETGGE